MGPLSMALMVQLSFNSDSTGSQYYFLIVSAGVMLLTFSSMKDMFETHTLKCTHDLKIKTIS